MGAVTVLSVPGGGAKGGLLYISAYKFETKNPILAEQWPLSPAVPFP